MMIETKQGLFNEFGLAMLNEARPCPVCKVAHFFFVNRNGRTTCAACAPVEEPARPALARVS